MRQSIYCRLREAAVSSLFLITPIFLMVLLILYLQSCQTSKGKFINGYEFALNKQLLLKLDERANKNSLSLNSFPSHNPKYLFYLHRGLNKASIYDLESSEKIKVVTWDYEGPHSIGYNAEFGCMVKFDTIILASLLENRLFITDTSSKIRHSVKLDLPVTRPTGTFVHQLPGVPLLYLNNRVFFSTYKSFWEDFSSALGAMEFNLLNGKAQELFNYPEIYHRNWWEGYQTLCGVTIVDNKNQVSWFSADSYVDIYNSNKKINRVYFGTEKLKLKPLGLKRPAHFDVEIFNSSFEHLAKNGWYAHVIYDPKQRLYYRIGFYGKKEDNYANFNDIYSNPFILIMNSEFRLLGEYPIDGKVYNVLNSFIGPEGLCMLNKICDSESDDILCFDCFQVIKVK